MIITFFGHSDYLDNSEDEEELFSALETIVCDQPVDFYLGGYGNFDSFAYRCAKRYKECKKNAKLVFITPYLDKWLNERKDFLIKLYDEIVYPPIEHVPQKFAILKRNEWMIDRTDHVIVYIRRHYGGAYKALLYAHKQNKPYTNLYKGNYELY